MDVVTCIHFALFCLAFFFAANQSVNLEIPEECVWDGFYNNLTLVCYLKTINSEFENTNLSVIQSQNIMRLHLICSQNVFFRSNLNSGSFKEFVDLQSLTIEFCKFETLSRKSFLGLTHLNSLVLRSHNADWASVFLEINSDAFTELQHVETVDLSLNSILKIEQEMFCPMKRLQNLNLSHNAIQNVDFSNTSSRTCRSSIKKLDLSFNRIYSLSAGVFSQLELLEVLNMSGNSLKYMQESTFEGLMKLRIVDLSRNKLTSLPCMITSNPNNLRELYISNNKLSQLCPRIFNNIIALEVLDLSNNDLYPHRISNETFTNCNHLLILNLSGNNLSKLHSSMFKYLNSLKILKLEWNLIETLPNSLFQDLKLLTNLALSNNQINIINYLTFRGLVNLKVLSLDYNQINHLHIDSLIHLPHLEELHINSNKLVKVPDTLMHLGNLKSLDMGENLIKSIENCSLTNLNTLVGLRLTDNKIVNVTAKTFFNNTAMRILNLSQNNITFIENGSFRNNNELQAIRVDRNNINKISDIFNKLPKLLWLNVSHNALEEFEYGNVPASLQWLDISNNKITIMKNNYRIPNEMKLNTLDISFNNITEIGSDSLINSLNHIYLNNNQIRSISPYTFLKKSKLRTVDLRNNSLLSFDEDAVRISPVGAESPIPKFFLSHNPFACDCKLDWLLKINVDSRILPKIDDLSSITCKMSYDPLDSLKVLVNIKESILCKYKTQCFALCSCCEFEACDCKMQCPLNCTCYHDEPWTLNIVNCSASGYDQMLPQHIPMDSTQILLDGNNFQKLGSFTFLGRKKLKVLQLNHSNIEELHNKTFFGLSNLETLRLNHNNIRALNGLEFQGLYSLKELSLNHNKISSIMPATLLNLSHLRVLHLDHNQIVNFPVWTELPIFLKSVTLSSNPWSCECDFLSKFCYFLLTTQTIYYERINMCTYLERNKNIYSSTFNLLTTTTANSSEDNEIKCDIKKCVNISRMLDNNHLFSNLQYKNETATGFDSKQNVSRLILTPTQNGFPIVQVYILIICGLFIFLSFTMLLFKDEILVNIFARFGIRFFKDDIDEDESQYPMAFDAFISYCSKDQEFILDDFAPIFEQKYPNYKIYLHHRDFRDFVYVTDKIINAINVSRRTIIVVSDNFINYEWKRLEYKAAFHSILQDRRKRMIVICLRHFAKEELDEDLMLYLKANKYLQWGEKMFWEKLRYVLPDLNFHHAKRSNFERYTINERDSSPSESNIVHDNVSQHLNIQITEQNILHKNTNAQQNQKSQCNYF